jgi:hypothetical protein
MNSLFFRCLPTLVYSRPTITSVDLQEVDGNHEQAEREREQEGAEFDDKEKFVTGAYKRKLEQLRVAAEEEKRRDAEEGKFGSYVHGDDIPTVGQVSAIRAYCCIGSCTHPYVCYASPCMLRCSCPRRDQTKQSQRFVQKHIQRQAREL